MSIVVAIECELISLLDPYVHVDLPSPQRESWQGGDLLEKCNFYYDF